MDIDERLQEYAERVSSPHDPLLAELSETTRRSLGAPEMQEFDLVFLDADKAGYVGYYEAVLPRLSPHGLIVADNTLHGGRVFDPGDPIAAFNEHVAADARSVQVLLTVRDGMTLMRRA